MAVQKNLAQALAFTDAVRHGDAPLSNSATEYAGRQLLTLLLTVQGLSRFALITLGVMWRKHRVAPAVIRPRVRQEIQRCGVALLPLFLLVAFGLGVLVVGQTAAALANFGAFSYLGKTMVIVIVRELGPMLTAMLLLARVGTAHVIELGTARSQGEVEALEIMGIDPVHYLIVPRVIGMMTAMFSLAIYLIMGALVSGYLCAFVQNVPLTPGDYFRELAGAMTGLDFVLLAVKTVVFGFFIAIVACYHGLAQPLRLEEVSQVAVRTVTEGVMVCLLVDLAFIGLYRFT